MWCNNCNIETNDSTCPLCGAQTIEDLPVEIYWCDHCQASVKYSIRTLAVLMRKKMIQVFAEHL